MAGPGGRGEEGGGGRLAGGEAARGGHVRAGAGGGGRGCCKVLEAESRQGSGIPPRQTPTNQVMGSPAASDAPTRSLPHERVGTNSGQTCDSAHGPAKPGLSVWGRTRASRPRGGEKKQAWAPVCVPRLLPLLLRRCLQTHCRAQASERSRSGGWALILGTAPFSPHPARDVGLIGT